MTQVYGFIVLAAVVVLITYQHIVELRSPVNVPVDRSIEDLSRWRLVLLNLGYRLVEIAERGALYGDALLDRLRDRWVPPAQRKAAER